MLAMLIFLLKPSSLSANIVVIFINLVHRVAAFSDLWFVMQL
ncbi:hypothetical protein Patl1_37377 [Pistacia atlantica]|nr:hypothetical protein Patl1_37377 [Pistacia atlantica]